MGNGCAHRGQRRGAGRNPAGWISSDRARVARGRQGRIDPPDAVAGVAPVPGFHCDRARAAGLLAQDWRGLEKAADKSPAADWEVYPATPWNYGLALDPARPEATIVAREKSIGEYPFSPEGAPVELVAQGRRVPGWRLVNGSAASPPPRPVQSDQPRQFPTPLPY